MKETFSKAVPLALGIGMATTLLMNDRQTNAVAGTVGRWTNNILATLMGRGKTF